MVVAIRLSRVGSVLASVIHSIYSRRWDGGILSKLAFEMAHGSSVLYLHGTFRVLEKRRIPETKGAMLFEAGHIAKQAAAVFEEWHAPFDRFGCRRAGLVHELAQVLEDGPGKFGTFRNIGVDARIGVHLGVVFFFIREFSNSTPNAKTIEK
jgi:hypothetical protein